MVEQILPSLAQAFLVSLIGAGCGHRFALRNAASVHRSSESWQIKAILAAGVCGAFFAIIFQIWLEISYPHAPPPQLFMLQFLFGFGVAKFLTKRFLKRTP